MYHVPIYHSLKQSFEVLMDFWLTVDSNVLLDLS